MFSVANPVWPDHRAAIDRFVAETSTDPKSVWIANPGSVVAAAKRGAPIDLD
jgi:hypothetical protein